MSAEVLEGIPRREDIIWVEDLTNKELLDVIKKEAIARPYALELERRWKEFWEAALNKGAVDPNVLQREASLLRQQVNEDRSEAVYLEGFLKKLRKKISECTRKLKKITESDFLVLEASTRGYKANAERHKNLNMTLEAELLQLKRTISTLTQEKAVLLRRKNAVVDAQQRLVERNMARIERDLRKVVLMEAGVF